MLKFKKFLSTFLPLFLAVLFITAPCHSITAQTLSLPDFIILSNYKTTLDIGKEFYIAAITSTGKKPTWKSSDSKIASVNTYGKITAKKAGTATITAKIKGAEASAKVTVNPTKITINKNTASLERGETLQLSATTSNNSKVKWKSSKPSIAAIDENGVVTGKKPGETTITATANGTSTTSTVTVKSPSLKLSRLKVTLYRGQTVKINATSSSGFSPTWRTNKKSVAIVDDKGTITAIKNGTAIITATLDGVATTCEVTVEKPTIQLSETEITIAKGESFRLSAKVSSGNTPLWSTSNQVKASVDSKGNVTGLEKGKAYIYASEDGTKVKCTVHITN